MPLPTSPEAYVTKSDNLKNSVKAFKDAGLISSTEPVADVDGVSDAKIAEVGVKSDAAFTEIHKAITDRNKE